jgi:hypothetical protein
MGDTCNRNSDRQKVTSMLQENRVLTPGLALILLVALAPRAIAGQTAERPAAQLVSELDGLLSPNFPAHAHQMFLDLRHFLAIQEREQIAEPGIANQKFEPCPTAGTK